VQPAWLYFDASQPSASLQLRSASAEAASVTARVREKSGDVSAASCADWLRFDTGTVGIAPRAATTFAVTVDLPAGVTDGEYAADLVFSGSATTDNEGDELIVPVHVRVGEVYSDVKLAGADAERKDGEVIFRFHLTQLGNAAYRGTLVLRLEDGKGREVHAREGPVDVYGKGIAKIVLPSASVPPGRYRVFMNFDSDREDLGTRAIPVLPKKYTIDISMP
jgi:hypothetical protein